MHPLHCLHTSSRSQFSLTLARMSSSDEAGYRLGAAATAAADETELVEGVAEGKRSGLASCGEAALKSTLTTRKPPWIQSCSHISIFRASSSLTLDFESHEKAFEVCRRQHNRETSSTSGFNRKVRAHRNAAKECFVPSTWIQTRRGSTVRNAPASERGFFTTMTGQVLEAATRALTEPMSARFSVLRAL